MQWQLEEPEKRRIADELATKSIAVSELPATVWRPWAARLDAIADNGDLRPAGVGGGARVEDVRRDSIFWLEESSTAQEDRSALGFLDGLRHDLSRDLLMPLPRTEAHFALYPPGGFYETHVDRHRGTEHRLLTFILYLNENWTDEDGGHLEIFDPVSQERLQQFAPIGGRLILFRSEVFPHRVATSKRTRKSLTGWFRH